eukprot:1796483-Pleurochrysis_carterae.AAC.2
MTAKPDASALACALELLSELLEMLAVKEQTWRTYASMHCIVSHDRMQKCKKSKHANGKSTRNACFKFEDKRALHYALKSYLEQLLPTRLMSERVCSKSRKDKKCGKCSGKISKMLSAVLRGAG